MALDKRYALIVIAYIVFIAFNLLLTSGRIGYDAGRNEKIISELAYYGTYTYFDVPFIVSPPLYFMIHTVPVSFFGTDQEVFLFTEATFYFLGAFFALLIVRELFPKKWFSLGFFVLLLLLIDGKMFPGIHSLDFWGIMLFFSSLVLLFYIRYYKRGGLHFLPFGIVVGLAMLVKSSFAFLFLPLVVHYLVFMIPKRGWKSIGMFVLALVIGVVIYSPWLLYLSSNGFPLITNPEFYGSLPWDPDFSGYSIQDIYANVITEFWPVMYPFSIIVGLFAIASRLRKVQFDVGISMKRKVEYFFFRYRKGLGGMAILLLLIILTLPLFNRLLVAIPVGEQFLSIALAFYLLLAIVFATTKKIRWAIVLLVIVNLGLTVSLVQPLASDQQYQNTCPLYSEFFSSLGPDTTVFVDERLSPITYPTHNVIYEAFFEWFSYNDEYDIPRLVNMNADYLVVIEGDRIPAYTTPPLFERQESFFCEDVRTGTNTTAVIFSVNDQQIAESVGLPHQAKVLITGGGKPLQADLTVSAGEFVFTYKSKRDGSLVIFVPQEGTYNVRVVRTGFQPVDREVEIPSGDILINLEADSPFITHTTANRY